MLGRAVGEGDSEGKLRRHSGGDDGGEAIGHDAGLAGASGGQYEQRAMEMAEDLLLLGVGIGHRLTVMLIRRGAGDKVKAGVCG